MLRRLVAVLRQVFLVAPCRLYVDAEDRGRLPLRWFAIMFGSALGLGGIGGLLALSIGRGFVAGFAPALVVGFITWAVWAAYSVLAFVVLWALGRSPAEFATSLDQSPGRHATTDVKWRRRGRDPLVPGGAVAFFAFLTVFGLGTAAWTQHGERHFSGPKTVADSQVLRWDDGLLGLGKRQLVVTFVAEGQPVTGRVHAGDVEGAVPNPGERLRVEYLRDDPHKFRPAGTSTSKASDVTFWVGFAVVCGVLCGASGVGYISGRRRHRHDN